MGRFTDTVRLIVEAVEKKTGFLFLEEEVGSVYDHTARKLEVNGEGEDYFSVLFENELEDFVMRRRVNAAGALA